MRGRSTPSPTRAYIAPMCANCSRCGGLHSTVAPASSSTAAPCLVGTVGASAGRSTPGSMPNAACAATTLAPVWPALNSAAASPGRDVLGGDANRRARLAAQRLRRRFDHLDHVGRVDDAHVEIACVGMPRQLGANQILAADQIDTKPEIARGGHGAINGMGRRMIAAHRINGDAHMSQPTRAPASRLGLRDADWRRGWIGAAVRSVSLR